MCPARHGLRQSSSVPNRTVKAPAVRQHVILYHVGHIPSCHTTQLCPTVALDSIPSTETR